MNASSRMIKINGILILLKHDWLLFTLFYSDFPLDVTIDSFSYEENISIIKWKPVESGDCQVKYDLTIANQTAIIKKESIEGNSSKIPEMTEPTDVWITAVHGSRRGSVSAVKIFIKTVTSTSISQWKLRI